MCLDSESRKIVPKRSATLDRYPSIGIHVNHIDMTKFSSNQDPDYQNVLSELRRLTRLDSQEANTTSRLASSESSIKHEKVSSTQQTSLANTFSGTFNSGGGKMIQGGEFNSGGGSINF